MSDSTNHINEIGQEDVSNDSSNNNNTNRDNMTWNEPLTLEKRRILIHKIVKTLLDVERLDPNGAVLNLSSFLEDLVKYAIHIEFEMYNKSNSLEEYFHFLAENIYLAQNRLKAIPIFGNINSLNLFEYLTYQRTSQPSSVPQISNNSNRLTSPLSSMNIPASVTNNDAGSNSNSNNTTNGAKNITARIRKHLVKRIIAVILSPLKDEKSLNELNMVELIRYGKLIENRIHTKSHSKDEYFHLIAGYIYKIQKSIRLKQFYNYDRLIKTMLNIKFDVKSNFRE